ncbi:hypothetical protein SARC_08327 [Sphaeroforma arctica JP610]|uniref:C2H2-type domain-containing protein n=1 Tax=Sphaeroforma arctica JP610 TaxID=667725 RepID=A0A0L0FR78_9EUKA|nr:hypothetical protein SARC_08327 [Sphaeroforma arctica JP610]KNC79275.1 hypothetical protein SARC_08327 [Sphaeroforma arctica JP610]|eukprot:XP_014153177.1 hypothetical protein SARC_08327 [Sphaeroforma arctica JP610]
MSLDPLDETTLPVRSASMQAQNINTQSHTLNGSQIGAVYPIPPMNSPKRDPQVPSRRHRRGGNELLRPFTCRYKGCTNRYQAWRSLQYHMSSKHLIKTKLVRNRIAVLDANGADLSRFDLDVNYDFTDRDGGGAANGGTELPPGGQVNKRSQTPSDTELEIWHEARKMLQATTNLSTLKEGVAVRPDFDYKENKVHSSNGQPDKDMYGNACERSNSQPQGEHGLVRGISQSHDESQSVPNSAGLDRSLTAEDMYASEREGIYGDSGDGPSQSHTSANFNASTARPSNGEGARGPGSRSGSGSFLGSSPRPRTASAGWGKSAHNVGMVAITDDTALVSAGKVGGHSRRHSTNGVLVSDLPSQPLPNVQSYGGSHTHQLGRNQAIQHQYNAGMPEPTFHGQMESSANQGSDGLLESVLQSNMNAGVKAEMGQSMVSGVEAQTSMMSESMDTNRLGFGNYGEDLDNYYARLFGSGMPGAGLDPMQMASNDSPSGLDLYLANSMGCISEGETYNIGTMVQDGMGIGCMRSTSSRPVNTISEVQEDHSADNSLMRRWSGGQPFLSNINGLSSDVAGITSPVWFQSMQNSQQTGTDQNPPNHSHNSHNRQQQQLQHNTFNNHQQQQQLEQQQQIQQQQGQQRHGMEQHPALSMATGAVVNSGSLRHSTQGVFKFPTSSYTFQNSGNMTDMSTSGGSGSGATMEDSTGGGAAWLNSNVTSTNALYTAMEEVVNGKGDKVT